MPRLSTDEAYKAFLCLPIGTDFSNYYVDGFAVTVENLDRHYESSPYGQKTCATMMRLEEVILVQEKIKALKESGTISSLVAQFLMQNSVEQIFTVNSLVDRLKEYCRPRQPEKVSPSMSVIPFMSESFVAANTNGSIEYEPLQSREIVDAFIQFNLLPPIREVA